MGTPLPGWRRPVVRSLVATALLAGAVVGPPAAHAAAARDGLVLRYKLDERSGRVAVDSSGNGRDGAVSGSPGWTAGQGLTFDGSSTYVRVPDNVMSGLSAITVATDVWIDPA